MHCGYADFGILLFVILFAGDTLDRSQLFLLHGDPLAQTWTDITSQVVLQITHIYAHFQVDHFSWSVCFMNLACPNQLS